MGKAIQGYIKLVDNPQYIPYSDNLQLFVKFLVLGNMKKRFFLFVFLSKITTKLPLSQKLLLSLCGSE